MLVASRWSGMIRGVKVYDVFIEGAKEGFEVAVRIIPFLVGILVAIGMFRGSGAMDLLTAALRPLMTADRFSRGARAAGDPALAHRQRLARVHDRPDQDATARTRCSRAWPRRCTARSETTFYVLAVYFGAVGVKRTRHAVPAALIGDVVAAIATVAVCMWMFR